MILALTIIAGCAVATALAGLVWLWTVERAWRPMVRGYLEHVVGDRLPDASPLLPETPGRVGWPPGDVPMHYAD